MQNITVQFFFFEKSISVTAIHCHSILQSYPFYDLVLHTAILSDGTLCLWGTDWLHSTQDQRQIPDKHCKKILMFDLNVSQEVVISDCSAEWIIKM